MVDSARGLLPGFERRFAEVLASGVDPTSYTVNVEQLRTVIRAANASATLKEHLIAFFDENIIKGKAQVSCMVLGIAMAVYTEHTKNEDILNITGDIMNLDKLPYSYTNGRRVS